MSFIDIIFGSIGAFVRWLLKGFRTKFKDELYGTNDTDFMEGIDHHFVNFVIGFIIFMIICVLIATS